MTHSQKSWVLGLGSAASLMAALDAMVVATSLNTIRLEFDASIETLQWTLNAYNLAAGVFNMFRFLGGVSGIAGAVAIFAVAGGTRSVATFSSGFSAAIRLSAAFSIAAAATAMALRSRRHSQVR
jgi:hypothetical protein